MFENKTFENLLSEALERVSNDVDKRQGSIIYDAIAPICAELAQAYIDLDIILKEGFADTASREYLIKRAKERGITPYSATNSIVLAKMTGNFKLVGGERFNCEDLNFFYLAEMEGDYYKLICETSGSVGNISYGSLLPIDNIPNIETAEIVSLFSPARDEESTESFRDRYFQSFESLAFGGNRADYMEKLTLLNEDMEILQNGGIGGIKVYRTPQGGGNIEIFITNNNYTTPTEKLLNLVQEKIDPKDETGEGVGIAPIGHKVNINPVRSVNININTSIVLKDGYTLADVLGYIENAVESYLHSLRENWEKEILVIRIAQIESCILNVVGVLDIKSTTINGTAQNLILDEYSIPIKEELNVTS